MQKNLKIHGNVLIKCLNPNITSIAIPYGIRIIEECAFAGCKQLKSIILPESIEIIKNRAFCDCTKLTSINLPDSILFINDFAFRSCKSLTSIRIPNQVTIISGGTFYGCENLTSVVLGDNISTIDINAFSSCYNLKEINFPDNLFEIGHCAFTHCRNLNKIFINNSSQLKYIGDSSFYDYNKNANNEEIKGPIIAYKGFKSDLTCREFQYEIGKNYHLDDPKLCVKGFHACLNPLEIFNYYYGTIQKDLRVCKVLLSGKIISSEHESKVVASDIEILKELTFPELILEFNENNLFL